MFSDSVKSREPLRKGTGDQLRRELVQATADLLLSPRPVEAPSLRQIARRCGVAPSAVYMHFASQDELIAAVIAEQFDSLRATLLAEIDVHRTPLEQISRIVRAYHRWAIDHPGAYQLIFERPDIAVPDDGAGPGTDLLDLLVAPLRILGATAPAAARLSLLLWSVAHGITSLRIHKTGAPWSQTADQDLDAAVDAIVQTLAQQ